LSALADKYEENTFVDGELVEEDAPEEALSYEEGELQEESTLA
jgi:hypothetical protein